MGILLPLALCFLPLFVDAALHSYIITYTKVQGISGVQFTAVTEVDDREVCYYDCHIQKLIPKQEWMKKTVSEGFVNTVAARDNQTCTLFTKYTDYVKNLFSQTGGVNIYQRRYGCTWDDETNHSNKFDAFGYNGEDIIILEENKYIPSKLARDKWKDDIAEGFLERDTNDCVSWLKHFLTYGKSHVERIVAPKVFLIQKDPSSPVVCQATSFYPANLTITWTRNSQAYNNKVDPGEFQLNEDGTFQISSTLTVTPEEWNGYQFYCEVNTPYGSWIHKEKTDLKCNNGCVLLTDSPTVNWNKIVVIVCGLLALIVGMGALAYGFGKCRKSSKSLIPQEHKSLLNV